jgi:hypothetical protein
MTTLKKFLQDWREVGIQGRSLTDDEILKIVKDWIKQWHGYWREHIQYEELDAVEVLPLLAKQLGIEVQNTSKEKQTEGGQ